MLVYLIVVKNNINCNHFNSSIPSSLNCVGGFLVLKVSITMTECLTKRRDRSKIPYKSIFWGYMGNSGVYIEADFLCYRGFIE